jgi:hypothetical protein
MAPVLAVDCEATTASSSSSSHIELFPNASQVIATVDLGFAVVSLSSEPNSLPNMTFSLVSQCPYGFAIPDDPLSDRGIAIPGELIQHHQVLFHFLSSLCLVFPVYFYLLICWQLIALLANIVCVPTRTGTACSARCPIQVYTPAEYEQFYLQTEVCLFFALFLNAVQTVNIFVVKSGRRNIFLVASILSSFLYVFLQAVQLVAMQAPALATTRALTCASPTDWHSLHDIVLSSSDNSNSNSNKGAVFCAVTGVLSPAITLLAQWIMLAMVGEIWLRVVRGVKKVEDYRLYYMYLPAALLIVQALVMYFALSDTADVMQPGAWGLFCAWSVRDPSLQYFAVTLPYTIYLAVALLLFAHSLYTCVSTALKVQDADRKPLRKIWKSYGMLFLFLALDLAVFPVSIFLFFTKWNYVDATTLVAGSTEWMTCLFAHFVDANQQQEEDYLRVCGHFPANRIDPRAILSAFLCTAYTTPVVLVFITLNKEAKAFWRDKAFSFARLMGVTNLVDCLWLRDGSYVSLLSSSLSSSLSRRRRDSNCSNSCESQSTSATTTRTGRTGSRASANDNHNNDNNSHSTGDSRYCGSLLVHLSKLPPLPPLPSSLSLSLPLSLLQQKQKREQCLWGGRRCREVKVAVAPLDVPELADECCHDNGLEDLPQTVAIAEEAAEVAATVDTTMKTRTRTKSILSASRRSVTVRTNSDESDHDRSDEDSDEYTVKEKDMEMFIKRSKEEDGDEERGELQSVVEDCGLVYDFEV